MLPRGARQRGHSVALAQPSMEEMGTAGCVIAGMGRPSAVTAHEQGEGSDDPSEGFPSSTIHGASAGKCPVNFHDQSPQVSRGTSLLLGGWMRQGWKLQPVQCGGPQHKAQHARGPQCPRDSGAGRTPSERAGDIGERTPVLRLVCSVGTVVTGNVHWTWRDGGSQRTTSQNDGSCESAQPPTAR